MPSIISTMRAAAYADCAVRVVPVEEKVKAALEAMAGPGAVELYDALKEANRDPTSGIHFTCAPNQFLNYVSFDIRYADGSITHLNISDNPDNNVKMENRVLRNVGPHERDHFPSHNSWNSIETPAWADIAGSIIFKRDYMTGPSPIKEVEMWKFEFEAKADPLNIA